MVKPSQQFLVVEGYRQLLIQQVDVWNGGLDGQSGMLYAEIFRLAEAYPENLEALNHE